jgi:hypothetical protein
MSELTDNAGECKPALDSSDADALIRVRRAKSPALFRNLVVHYRSRGVPLKDIFAAMACSPLLVDAIGQGRQRP